MRRSPRDDYRPWRVFELTTMRRHGCEGAEIVAGLLQRSVSSVRCAASRYGISLRVTRRGAVLGQPRGIRVEDLPQVLRDLRERHLAGDDELAELERIVRSGRSETLCPLCGLRPATPTNGVCLTCHTRELTAAHEQRLEELAAVRSLATAQQQISRARRQDAAWAFEAVDDQLIERRRAREARLSAPESADQGIG